MADIFGYSDTVGKQHFANMTGKAVLKIGSSSADLIQQWRVNYQQQVSPIYECGSSKVYYSGKHGSGTLTVGRIVSSGSFKYSSWGTVCKPAGKATINAREGCGNQSSVNVKLTNLILTSVGFSGNAQNAYVGEDLTAMFAGLST